MEQNETRCDAPPGAPILRNHEHAFQVLQGLMTKQEQAKLAASSIESIVNGRPSTSKTASDVPVAVGVEASSSVPPFVSALAFCSSLPNENIEKDKAGPNRCSTCRKRVGLTGFNCRCGKLFCAVHRYSKKHDCPFDYRTTAQDAIAKANPVVKAEKVNKMWECGLNLRKLGKVIGS